MMGEPNAMKEARGLKTLFVFCAVLLSGVAWAEKYDPEYERYVEPLYPPYLGDKGISGCVKLTYIVQREGSVTDIRVLESTNQRFTNAATFAVA